MEGRLQITDGAFLRLLNETDARELHDLIEANRTHLAPWLPWAAGQTFEDTLDFIRGTRSQLSDNNGFQAAVVIEDSIVSAVGQFPSGWTFAKRGRCGSSNWSVAATSTASAIRCWRQIGAQTTTLFP